MYNKLCIIPFINLSPRPDGRPKVCSDGIHKHVPEYNLNKNTVEDFWNGEFMKDLRMSMINNKTHPHCEWCNNIDSTGGQSKRASVNKTYMHLYEDRIENAKHNDGYLKNPPTHWEFRFSNKCNLACLSCGPTNSTLWEKQLKKNQKEITNFDYQMLGAALSGNARMKKYNSDFFISQFWENVLHIKKIELHGGEPFYDKECLELLEKLTTKGYSKNIELKVHTNMTVINKDIINLLNQFKDVDIKASIDAYGEKNEFIRWPSSWETIEKNCHILNKHSKFRKNISVTVSLFNIVGLHELYTWQENTFPDWEVYAHVAYLPKRLSLKILPHELRNIEAEKLLKHNTSEVNKKNINLLLPSILIDYKYDKQIIKDFVKYCNSIDKIRNQNTLEMFPHLESIYNEYEKIKD